MGITNLTGRTKEMNNNEVKLLRMPRRNLGSLLQPILFQLVGNGDECGSYGGVDNLFIIVVIFFL